MIIGRNVFMVRTFEEIAEEASMLIDDLIQTSEETDMDHRMISSFVDRNAHLIKDMSESIALMQERVDIISLKP